MSTSPAQLQPRTNATLWALIGLLGVAAASYFFVAPQIAQLADVRVSSAALAADKKALQLRVSEVSALDQRLTQNQAALDQLSLAVPDGSAVDQLLVSLQAMATSSGIVLSTIQPSAQESTGGVSVSLSARGSYAGIHLFLEALGKNLRPIKVTDLSLSAASDVAGASLINTSMQIVAATTGTVQPAPGAATAAGKAAAASSSATGPDATKGANGK